MMRHQLAVASLVLLVGCSSGTTSVENNNPLDPANRLDIQAPDVTQVTVGSNRIQLEWEASTEDGVDGYVILRRELEQDPIDQLGFRVIDTTSELVYLDAQARDGRTYEYQLAVTVGDQYGVSSPSIEASSGFFTAVINGQDPITNTAAVQVTFGSVPATEAVQLSESAEFTGATWRAFGPNLSWTLSAGDGDKQVFSRFRFSNGSESFPVYDTIRLDTRAVILSVSYDGAEVRAPGETVHFAVDAEEPDGVALLTVVGLFQDMRLLDDGTEGDAIPGDGVYERDVVLPAGQTVTDAVVRASFTDEAGNQAGPADGARTLSVQRAPDPVVLSGLEAVPPPAAVGVRITWTQSLAGDFSSYRVYRSLSPSVSTADKLVASIASLSTLDVLDSEAGEGMTYYYRVFVRTGTGQETGSNTLSLAVPNVRPPGAVNLSEPDGISFNRISLRWDKSPELDFSAYRLYRNTTGAVDQTDDLVVSISDADAVFFTDDGLAENTEYFYRIYVVDTAGLITAGNQRSVWTRNDPPAAVSLSSPSQVTTTAATLSWSRSTADDFESYRLFRSEASGVTTDSELVVEINDPNDTSFRDLGLTEGTTYYWRVFVTDRGPEPEATGSNTVNATTSGEAP